VTTLTHDGANLHVNSRGELLQKLLKPFTFDGFAKHTVHAAISGNELWTVEEIELKSGRRERQLYCYTLFEHANTWRFRVTDERHFPPTTVPVEFLDLVPVRNPAWRDRVMNAHVEQLSRKDELALYVRGAEAA
jgi:hypothetical protein